MPVYVHCPRCGHPTIVRAPQRSTTQLCRQCHAKYALVDSGSGRLDRPATSRDRPGPRNHAKV